MRTIELHDVQSRLPELVQSLQSNGEIIIAAGEKPVARLVPFAQPRVLRPLREFAGAFRPLTAAEQNDVKPHDRDWCGPTE